MIAFEVNDMTCGHCVSTITKAVKQTDEEAVVSVDLASKRVQIESKAADETAFKEAIEEAGYTPVAARTAASPATPAKSGGGCGC